MTIAEEAADAVGMRLDPGKTEVLDFTTGFCFLGTDINHRYPPAEPEGSRLCDGIRQRAFAVVERGGVLFAYLGPGEPPAWPHFELISPL